MTTTEDIDEPERTTTRITPKAARKMLGMIGKNYSDADLAEILCCLYGVAELGFELYQEAAVQSDKTCGE